MPFRNSDGANSLWPYSTQKLDSESAMHIGEAQTYGLWPSTHAVKVKGLPVVVDILDTAEPTENPTEWSRQGVPRDRIHRPSPSTPRTR
jgi:hypothetical protein